MKQHLHIVALRTVRHSDRHSILTVYSREAGRMAFAVPAGAGREATRRRALLMPLGLAECVADIKPGREIHQMSEPRSDNPLHGLRSNPVKSAVAMFVAELLGVVLRDGPPDEGLFDFICRSVLLLDALPAARTANFHICFLYYLGRYLGIEPDTESFREGCVFDMVDGTFRMTAPMHRHYLEPQRARAVAMLGRMTFANMHLFRMTRLQRNDLLDGVLEYYSLHYTGLGGLHSLDVLREIF